MPRTIAISVGTTSAEIRDEDVYFAFPDGSLNYDCIACNATCCRGHGFVLHSGPEVQMHLAVNPSLRFFIESCGPSSQHLHVNNCPPACFALDSSGRCQIQAVRGYEAKPETCRLFPFNDIRQVGDWLVVSPHQSLCPLRVSSPTADNPCSSYASLLSEMKRGGVRNQITKCGCPPHLAAQVIALERRIVDLAHSKMVALSYADFAIAQMSLTQESGLLASPVADTDLKSCHAGFTDTLYQVCDVDDLAVDVGDLDVLLIGMTPTLRARLLFPRRDVDERWVRSQLAYLPLFLTALAMFVRLCVSAGMKAITYQTVSRLCSDNESLFHMLAHLSTVMVWDGSKAPKIIVSGDSAYQAMWLRILAALQPLKQNSAGASLGRILTDSLRTRDLERVLMIKQLAKDLDGNIIPLALRNSYTASSRSLSRAALSYLVSHASPELLAAAIAGRRHVHTSTCEHGTAKVEAHE